MIPVVDSAKHLGNYISTSIVDTNISGIFVIYINEVTGLILEYAI